MQNEDTPTEVNPFMDIAAGMSKPPAAPTIPTDNPFMDLAPSVRTVSQPPAMGSLSAVAGINPDQAAEATKLGTPLGIGQDLALRNMDELRRRSMIASVQRSGMLQNNPRLAQSLLDPVFAAQAHDDLDSLQKTSSLFDKVVSVFDAPNWMFGFKTVAEVTGGVERGLGTVERGELGSKQAFGSATPEQLARLEVLDKKLGAIPPGGIVSMTAEVVAQQLATIRSVGTTALIGAGVGAAVSGPAALVGAVGGFLAGGAAGLMATTTQTEAGNLYRDMVNQGVDPDTARYAALTGGLLNGIIELAGAKIAAGPFKALASKYMKEAVGAAVAKPTARAAMAIAGKEYAKQVGTETAEEVGQELVAITTEEIAKAMDGIDSETSFKDAMTRLVDAGIAGFQGSLVLGGIGPTSNFVVDLRRAEATTKQQEFFDGLDAAKKDGKLPKRNLDAYEGFLASQAKGTTADTVYVEAEAAAQVLAQSGLSAEQLEQSIPGIREQLRNALENGGDVTIPTSVYGARLAGTPLGDALRQHVRLSPEAMSVAQAQEFSRKRDALRQEAQEVLASKQETDAAFVAEAQQVEDAAYEQIKATGAFSDIESRTLASLRQAMVVVDAAEAGMTPLQYERERGVPLQVRGPQAVQEGRVPAAAAVDTTIGDEQINLIQTQMAPATAQVQQAIDANAINEKLGKQAKDSLRRINRAIESKNAGELAAAVYTAKKRNIPQLAQVVAAADQTLASLGVEVVDPVGREYLEGTYELEVVAFEPYQEGQTNEAPHVVRTISPIVRKNGQLIARGQVVVREGSPQYLARQEQVQEAKKAEMRARLVGAPQQLEQARRQPAPEKGVFDANNPPADVTAEGSRKAIMAVMDYEGKIYYDRAAEMHGDLLDSFPELDADLIIDGGFIRDGKYIPNMSDGGFAAIEGGRERLEEVKAFAEQANRRSPKLFEQAAVGATRGQFDLRSLIITINQGGDSSTLAHELIHLRIAEYIRMARSASPSARVVRDLELLFDFMGVQGETFAERLDKYESMPLEQRRPLEESVTYNFEVYLYENKAPSVELRGVFDRLARWIRRAYKSIRDDLNAIYRREFGKDLPILTPEVRQVFDRMLATTEQIARAQAVRGMKVMFQTQEQSGMPDAEWAALKILEQEATDAATSELTKATLKELQWYSNAQSKYLREMQSKHDRARKEIREEVSAQVQLEPVYRAMDFLKRGTIRTDTGEVTAATGAYKLDLAKVKAIMPAGFDPASLKYGKYGMVQEGGIDPDMAAGMFGYGSGVELINALLAAKPIKDEINARTDQRMVDENSDLATPEARQAAVDMAIHNDFRARIIAVEQRWLEKSTRPVNDMMQAARQVAQDIIGGVVIRTLNPRRYEAAEAEAARTATTAYREPQDPSTAGQAAATRAYNEAIAAGQTPDEATVAATEAGVAAVAKAQERRAEFDAKYGGREPAEVARRAKRQQLVQNQLAREAMLAKEEIAVAGRDFRKFFRSDEKLAKTRDMAPIMAARAILSYYGYGKRGESPAQYLDQLRTYAPDLYDGIAPIVMKSLSGTADYRDLTVTEFRVLRDTVQALWAQARRDRQITVEGERVALDVVLKEMADRLQAIGVGERVGQRQAPGAVDQANRHLLGLRAMMSRVEAWADALDGMAGPGAFTKYLFRPVKQAVDAYRIERNKYVERFVKLLDGIDLPVGKIAAPELDYTFGNGNGGIGRAELLGALMHTGNEGNYRKLLLGRKWGELDADGNLDDSRWRSFVARMISEGKLTKADYDFVQSIWDLLEEIKPLAQRAHFDMYGYYFKEVEATEVVTPFGTYRGGYVPAATDKFMVQDARVNASMDELEGDWRNSLPSTGAGFTKGRVEYNEALSLDLRLIATHTDAVLRFSMIQPSVKDALKILRDRDLKALLERFDPAVMENMLLPWLNRAARQQATEPGRWKLADKFWGGVRSRAGVATMFANLRNALQQVTGWFPSLLKVKRRYLQSALMTYLGSPKQTAEAIARLSPFMADRMRNQMFELQGTMNELLLKPSKYEKLQQWSSKHGYFLQQAFQNMVDITTWQGAYNQALAEGETQAEAVARGDAAVRLTQGSLSPEDKSMFEVGTPFYNTFVQFTGYFNMLANLNLGEFQKTVRDMGWRSGKGRLLYIYVMGMMLPAIVSDAIVRSLGGGWDDEDEDGYMDVFMDWFFGSQVRMGAALLPFGSTAYTAITTAFNDKPYDDRITTSPSIAALESATIGTSKAIIAVTDEDKDVTGRNVRDVLTLITLLTGVPVSALGRPAGYLIDVERNEIEPESGYDMIRGMITGTATPESKR